MLAPSRRDGTEKSGVVEGMDAAAADGPGSACLSWGERRGTADRTEVLGIFVRLAAEAGRPARPDAEGR